MTAAVAAPKDSSMFAVFKKRDFSLMWTAQLVSTIGSSLTDLAAAILVFRITNSALNVGLTLLVTALPTLFVGLFAGVFVDRFNRKRILLASDLLRGLLVISIPIIVANFGILGLYVILFLAATVRQFFDPAWESVMPEIASEEELSKANSFLSISSFGSTAVGFALAGLLSSLDQHKIELPFYIDGLTFFFSFSCVFFVRIAKQASSDESTGLGVVVANLRDGMETLWRVPLLRSLFIAGIPVSLSFGLWNVLLLPMAIRALHATEFEYGLQEGLTSVGFVIGALLLAKIVDRLAEGEWIVGATLAMSVCGIAYGLAPNIAVGIVFVMLSGFFNAPYGVARRTLLQRSTPREMRGRVFSAMFVSRDVLFLIGMAGAGLADIIDVRVLVIASSVVLFGAGLLAQVLPGIGRPAAEWRHALQLLRTAPAAPSLGAGRAAVMMDFDRLTDVLPELGALAMTRRSAFLEGATVAKAPSGTAIVKVGDPGDSAVFVLGGKAIAGVPQDGGQFRALSSMGAGDFFGEIAALTGSTRTANVVADEETELLQVPATTLKALMDLPEMNALVNSKLVERQARTANADLVRLAGLDQNALKDLRRQRRRPRAPVHHHDSTATPTHSG
jgi:MFS family permease